MNRFLAIVVSTFVVVALPANAGVVNWIDWQSSTTDSNGFTATGVITSGSETIDVTYHNPLGVGFFQDGVSGNQIDYYTASGANSPYESTGPNGVDNRPPAAEMIALSYAGSQTLTFSKTVQNVYLSFVSLNSNGWQFDQDFELLSYTGADLDGAGTDNAGYWGTGSVTRIDNGDGTYSLNNLTSGEPHGTLLLIDKFDTLSWDSLTNEFWNGFTVGVQGTDDQVPDVPLPAAGFLLAGGLVVLGGVRRRKAAA